MSSDSQEKLNSGKGLAVAILVIGVLGVVAIPELLIPALGRQHEANLRIACADNLKALGRVCKAFTDKQKDGTFPVLSTTPGQLMWTTDEVTPFIKDTGVFVCPADSDRARRTANEKCPVDDESYFYLGYAVTGEMEMDAFCAAYKERIAKGFPFDTDLQVPAGQGNGDGNIIHRLQEGVERFTVTGISGPGGSAYWQSMIPVLIERFENHNYVVPGGNVLFLDGHVEFVRYPGKWPMTPRTIVALEELDAMGK